MAVLSAQVAVSTSAVALNTETGAVAGTRLVVRSAGAGSIFLGASDVTTTTGYELTTGTSVTVDLNHGEQLYAIAAASQTAHVLRGGA